MIKNLFTVDVEEHFQVNNLSKAVKRSDWQSHESRVLVNTRRVLSLLDRTKIKGTFFVLGWIAERFPQLVKEIQTSGHEVASHGFLHKRICEQTPDEFRVDVRRSKEILESITGECVYGYRAPTYSITKQTRWALDILIEEGFIYDSSIFPFRYQRSGLAKDKRYPHIVNRKDKSIWELPISGLSVFGTNIPFSGGGYFRLCPLSIVKKGIRDINRTGNPAMVYIHPWEFDKDQPRFKLAPLSSFRHYYGLKNTESKLEELFKDVSFFTVRDFLKAKNRDTVLQAERERIARGVKL
jgi:polysaccharide deacetylase family protein (PEP-CTERM system associated)